MGGNVFSICRAISVLAIFSIFFDSRDLNTNNHPVKTFIMSHDTIIHICFYLTLSDLIAFVKSCHYITFLPAELIMSKECEVCRNRRSDYILIFIPTKQFIGKQVPPQTQAAADELLASHLANFFKTSLVIHKSLFVITQFYIIYLAEEWQHETQCTRFNKIKCFKTS